MCMLANPTACCSSCGPAGLLVDRRKARREAEAASGDLTDD